MLRGIKAAGLSRREKTLVRTVIAVQGVEQGKPQATAVGGIGKVAMRASANFAKNQEDVSIDEKKLVKLEVLRAIKSVSDAF